MKVLLIYGNIHFPSIMIEHLRSSLPRDLYFDLIDISSSEEEKIEKIRDADFIVVYPARFSSKEVEAAGKAKLIQLISAGYEGIDIEGATSSGIPVATNGGANAIAVAEHTIMLILSLYKKLILHHNSLKNGEWLGHNNVLSLYELTGKTIGIIGLGNIGKEVAMRAKGLRANVKYFDPVRKEDFEKELGVQYLPFEELLKTSDIVTIHVPLIEATRNLIGEKELESMKSSAVFINTSRGEIVDEKALYNALKDGKITSAGIDVFKDEGAIRAGKRKSPLLELENVIVTPHYAGATHDTWFRRIGNAVSNIEKIQNDQKPLWVINKSVLNKSDG